MPNYPYDQLATPLDLDNLGKANGNWTKIAADIASADSASRQRDTAMTSEYTAKFLQQRNEYTGRLDLQSTRIENIVSEISGDAFELVVDSATVNWKSPVSNFASLSTTYPNAANGDAAQTLDDNKTYRFNGTTWVFIQQFGVGPFTEVYNQLDEQKYYNNPKTFGAVGDGVADDTEAVRAAVNAGDVFFEQGTYLLDPTNTIFIPSNRNIIIPRGVTIKAKTNSADSYHVFRIFDVQNVTIEGGGSIIGDRDTHTGTTGESGMGISLYGSRNITIRDLSISKMWGDAIYIGRTTLNPQCHNVLLENLIIDNTRRNGISIISVDGITLKNIDIKNIVGILPEAGIDFEPNFSTEWINNVAVENVTINDTNGYGIVFGLGGITGTKDTLYLNFKNINTTNTRGGLYLTFGNLIAPTGSVVFEDYTTVNSKENGILIEKWSTNLPTLKLIRPLIKNANTSTTTGFRANAFVVRNASGDTWNQLGNIDVIEPYIDNTNAKAITGISVSPSFGSPQNISITDPRFLNMQVNDKIIVSPAGTNVTIRDRFSELVLPATDISVTTVANVRIIKKVTTSAFTAKRIVELDSTMTEGKEVTVTCDNNFGVSVLFDASVGLPYQSTTNGKLETTQKGASLTAYREAYGWRVTNLVGTWTTA